MLGNDIKNNSCKKYYNSFDRCYFSKVFDIYIFFLFSRGNYFYVKLLSLHCLRLTAGVSKDTFYLHQF